MVVHTCNANTQEAEQEDHEFEAVQQNPVKKTKTKHNPIFMSNTVEEKHHE
jgi:hypothetical protein